MADLQITPIEFGIREENDVREVRDREGAVVAVAHYAPRRVATMRIANSGLSVGDIVHQNPNGSFKPAGVIGSDEFVNIVGVVTDVSEERSQGGVPIHTIEMQLQGEVSMPTCRKAKTPCYE